MDLGTNTAVIGIAAAVVVTVIGTSPFASS